MNAIEKLAELNNEINRILAETKTKTEKEESRYHKEIESLYLEMAESLRPFYDVYKASPYMQRYEYKGIQINPIGWVLCFSDCGFYIGLTKTQITLDLRKGWNSKDEFVYHAFRKGDENNPYLAKLVTNWKNWFPIFERNFIETYHVAKAKEIEDANRRLEIAKGKAV